MDTQGDWAGLDALFCGPFVTPPMAAQSTKKKAIAGDEGTHVGALAFRNVEPCDFEDK